MPSLPSPLLRALEGLRAFSGRTVVVAGPPLSGKSKLLEELRGVLEERGSEVVRLRGSYRARSVPFGALDGLRAPMPLGDSELPPIDTSLAEPGEEDLVAPIAPVPFLDEPAPRSRRGRGERGRGSILSPGRSRSANEGDPELYWADRLNGFRGAHPRAFAILVEDGTLFDPDSREFLVWLSNRARLRPFLLVVALDSTNPGFAAWEEAFLGRGDVDWVRITTPLEDPREGHRLKAVWDDLPAVSQRVAGFVALLGGHVGEVVLSRVARLNFPQLADAILPAAGVGLLRVQDGVVTIPHPPWVSLTADLIPAGMAKEMHLDIANALVALSPDPGIARRVEVAEHFRAWLPGAEALRHLLDAGELSLQLQGFDRAEELLAEALECVGGLPPAERPRTESELRLLRARALFYAGRPAEAESQLREGLSGALLAGTPTELLAEWVEPLILGIRAVGPRVSLLPILSELAERCHDRGAYEVEVILESTLAEFHAQRRDLATARAEAERAAALVHRLPEGHLVSLVLVAVALSRIEGDPHDQRRAARYLEAGRSVLGQARRWELDYIAEELQASLYERIGRGPDAYRLRERNLGSLERQKIFSVELRHRLGIARYLLDEGTTRNVAETLRRARTICDTLHLLPPAPGLLELWLVEGRFYAIDESPDLARERWLALVDLPEESNLPAVRAEACLRLALMERARRQPEESQSFLDRFEAPEFRQALPAEWLPLLERVGETASKSQRGGGRLPPRSEGDPPPSVKARGMRPGTVRIRP